MTPESRRIKVTARIENLEDVFELTRGAIEPAQVRSLKVDDAMVDPKVFGLIFPSKLISRLGLRRQHFAQCELRAAPCSRGWTTPFGSPSCYATASLKCRKFRAIRRFTS